MGTLRQQAARTREVITNYRHMLETQKLDERLILIDSRCGRAFMGNMFYIAKELVENDAYKNFRIWLSAGRNTYAATKRFLQDNGLGRIKPVLMNSKRYFELLARAKFLVTDVCFSANWTKQAGQIVWNTWHGTPLKCMGRQMNDEIYTINLPQKHLLAADYLSFPNYHTAKHLLQDYMIDELFSGTLLFTGYPRNSIFFNKKRRKVLRSRLGLDNKRLYAYLPTYRVLPAAQNTPTSFQEILKNFDELLEDDEILFAKLHPLCADSIDFSSFKHVQPTLSEYETYDFLNICDALITDYSSVFFDFSITQKPVVLYTFDKENYLNSRGFCISIDELPFMQAKTAEQTLDIIREEHSVADMAFFEKFCSWENSHAPADLCARVFLSEPSRRILEENYSDGEHLIELQGKHDGEHPSGLSCAYSGRMGSEHMDSERMGDPNHPSRLGYPNSTDRSSGRRIKLLVHVGEHFFTNEVYKQTILEKLMIANFKQVAIYLTFQIPSSNTDIVDEVLLNLPEQLKYFPLAGTYIYTPHEARIAKQAQKKHEKALAQPQRRGAKNYLNEITNECSDAFKNANRRNFALLKPDMVINFDSLNVEKLVQFSLLPCPSLLVVPSKDNSMTNITAQTSVLNIAPQTSTHNTAPQVPMVNTTPKALLAWINEHYSAVITDKKDPLSWATQQLNTHGGTPA